MTTGRFPERSDGPSFATGIASPPVARIRYSGPAMLGAKRIVLSLDHDPPRGSGALARISGAPPLMLIVFNFALAKKPIERLSADQK